MTHVSISHTTLYRYVNPVTFGEHRLVTRPRDSHDMRLVEATLAVSPSASLRWKHDVFGNSVAMATFDAPADTLEIVSRIVIEHFPAATPDISALIEPYSAIHPFAYATEEIDDLLPCLRRHCTDPDRTVDIWARKFLSTSGPTDTTSLLVNITQAIKQDFVYQGREDEGTNSAPETLRTGAGACRDFALLMMEACRSLGMAARFVSGYLYDEALLGSEQAVVGGGATHAWCEVYLPGAGWVEFDPTNGLVGGRNLVRVAVTRTPEQAVPISGGFIGLPGDFIGMSVNVEVTVGQPDPPVDEPMLAAIEEQPQPESLDDPAVAADAAKPLPVPQPA